MNRSSGRAILLLLLCGAWGCGPELVGGGEHGHVRTTVSDEPTTGGAAEHRAGGPSRSVAASHDLAARQALLQGSATVAMAAELVTPAGGTIELSDGVVTRSVTIGADDRVEVGLTQVEAGVYPALRLTFSRVEATLASGGPLPLAVEVSLGAEPLVIDVPIEVAVRAERTTAVNVALNSAVWVALADPVTGVVERGEFAAVVTVSVEEGQ